jgi:hypothetical protein
MSRTVTRKLEEIKQSVVVSENRGESVVGNRETI